MKSDTVSTVSPSISHEIRPHLDLSKKTELNVNVTGQFTFGLNLDFCVHALFSTQLCLIEIPLSYIKYGDNVSYIVKKL